MTTAAAGQKLTCLALALILNLPLLSLAASPESQQVMDWPLQSGESIRDLSRLIYPKNPSMQKYFVQETIRLNRETQPDLNAGTVFGQQQQILIPSIKQLSKKSKTPPSAR